MKILRPQVIIIFLAILFSCRPGDTPPKKYFISRDSLVTILVDLHMVYSIQSTFEYRKLAEEYDSIDIYSEIFDKHNVTKAAFDSTIAYYSKHPEDLTNIYDEVIMQLTMMQDSMKVDH
jgi:hypothetical protein